jgi:hypothetical protein
MTKLLNIICYVLVSIGVNAQSNNQILNDSLIKGKISVETNDVDGIEVINLSSKSKTISSNGGFFSIKAKEKDTIQFKALHLDTKNYVLKKEDFKNNLLLVQLTIHTELLKEVTVTKNGITAESLGIIPKGQKKYTTAERKLETAKSGVVDPLINWISGRTEQLKKEATLEQKERLQTKITTAYEKEYLINVLGIPEIYINGFLFYVVEDYNLAEAVKLKNKTKIEFILLELSKEYLKIVSTNVKQ